MFDMEKDRGQTALFQFYDFGGGGGGDHSSNYINSLSSSQSQDDPLINLNIYANSG